MTTDQPMLLVTLTQNWNGYRAGETRWFHRSEVEMLQRMGVVEIEREAHLEMAVAPEAPELAVTRRGRRGVNGRRRV